MKEDQLTNLIGRYSYLLLNAIKASRLQFVLDKG